MTPRFNITMPIPPGYAIVFDYTKGTVDVRSIVGGWRP